MPMVDTEFRPPPKSVLSLVVRLYDDFLFLVALIAILSLVFTVFGLSQADGLSGPVLMAAVMLTSAAIVAIAATVAIAIIGVLRSKCRTADGRYERSDLIMSWVPLFLFDVVMLQAIAGLLLWYTDNVPDGSAIILASVILASLIILIVASLWVRRKIETLVAASCRDDQEAEELYCDLVHDEETGARARRENRFLRFTELGRE